MQREYRLRGDRGSWTERSARGDPEPGGKAERPGTAQRLNGDLSRSKTGLAGDLLVFRASGGVRVFVDQSAQDRFPADLPCVYSGHGGARSVRFAVGDALGDALIATGRPPRVAVATPVQSGCRCQYRPQKPSSSTSCRPPPNVLARVYELVQALPRLEHFNAGSSTVALLLNGRHGLGVNCTSTPRQRPTSTIVLNGTASR